MRQRPCSASTASASSATAAARRAPSGARFAWSPPSWRSASTSTFGKRSRRTVTPRPEVRGSAIAGTGMYVPDTKLTNQDFERMVDTSDEWIRERTGIIERRIAAPEQASSDLALEASKRALEMAGLGPEDVDQIIIATTTPDRYLPSCACTLQQKLGARRAAAYDLFAACTGFIYGLGLGRSVIASGMA